jgi:hypothetical protein
VPRISGATGGTFGFMWRSGMSKDCLPCLDHFVLALLCDLSTL